MKKKILSLVLALVMVIGMIPAAALTAFAADEDIPGGGNERKAWTFDNALPWSSGEYYLTSDVTLSKAWNVPAGKDISLDLNGHTIRRDLIAADVYGFVIRVSGKLTLSNSSEDKDGLITGGYNFTNGGGLYIDSGAVVNMTDCKIEDNKAIGAAGIYNEGTLTATRCSISNNHATGNAGGIYTSAGAVTLIDCEINNNRSDNFGGACFVDFISSVSLCGCTVSGNSAKNGGGAFEMEKEGCILVLEDSFVTGNSVDMENGGMKKGGGIHFYLGSVTFKGKVTIKDNLAAKVPNNIQMRGNAVTFDASEMSADSEVYVNDGVLAAIGGITKTNVKVLVMENGDHITYENSKPASHTPDLRGEYIDCGDGTHTSQCTLCDRFGGVEEHININADGMCDKCGAAAANYLAWNEENGQLEPSYENHTLTEVTSSTTELSDGWYIVGGDVTVERRMTVSGDVHLILADGCDLSTYGITVNENNSLNIYAQSEGDDMGTLTAKHIDPDTGFGYSSEASCAGIGGAGYDCDSGKIIIHGGNITAEGGKWAAGIGGGEKGSADVTIYGGNINAVGGADEDGFGGAGIGSGYTMGKKVDGSMVYNGTAGNIAIYGGNIKADGVKGCAAGIGGGYGSDGGTITIGGGNIEALGGYLAVGIGSSRDMPAGNITITGGIIKAVGDTWSGIDIGDDLDDSAKNDTGTVTVTGGYIDGDISAKTVSLPEGEPTYWSDNSKHIGYLKCMSGDPSCTFPGYPEYYKDKYSVNYYTDFPFTGENLIGDKDALNEWKSESGKALGHKWQNTDYNIHTCSVCTLTEAHADNDCDLYCDACRSPLSYYEYNEELKEFEVKPIPEDITVIKSADDLTKNAQPMNKGLLWDDWYLIDSSVTIDHRLEVNDYYQENRVVHLILGNNANLTVKGGFRSITPFVIYATTLTESKMGKINADASNKMGCAGIGGGYVNSNNGFESFPNDDITIHGGNITAKGGEGAAGIGGGYLGSDVYGQPAGDITIYGGKITAQGGESGAGIGAGFCCDDCNMNITIYGGNINADGGDGGAGIGSGGDVEKYNTRKGTEGDKYIYYVPASSVGDITIYGGTFSASGSVGGAGIGSGARGGCENITIKDGVFNGVIGNTIPYLLEYKVQGAAGIGSGFMAYCGDITFDGGIFYQIASTAAAPAIGAGTGFCPLEPTVRSCGDITFNGGVFSLLIGGFQSPAIGAGCVYIEGGYVYRPWCDSITFNGGFIEAIGGGYREFPALVTDAKPIGAGEGGRYTVNEPTVEYGENVVTTTTVFKDPENVADDREVIYIGEAVEATCEKDGMQPVYARVAAHTERYNHSGVYIDGITYYSDITGFTKGEYYDSDGDKITEHWTVTGTTIDGDCEEAFEDWRSTPESEGGGMIPALGHDAERIDEYTHKCQRCGIVEGHADLDSDVKCDACGEVMSPVSYYEYNEETKDFDLKTADKGVQYLYGNTEDVTLEGGCYAIVGDVTAEGNITFDNDTLLILTEGCKLSMEEKSIYVSGGHHLNICADTLDASTMEGICIQKGGIILKEDSSITINGGTVNADTSVDYPYPGAIGGADHNTCGDITINGGRIIAKAHFGAAIGAGYGSNTKCGNITINGGDITAISHSGSGIGAGSIYSSCGDVIINGGSIKAHSYDGAGIGSGDLRCTCKNIVINGGNITAESEIGAAIGAGYDDSTCDKVTISGGSITAESEIGAAIGAGFEDSTCGKVTISDGNVSAYSKEASAIEADEIEISDKLYLFAGEDEGKAVAVEKYDGEAYACICASPVVFNTMSLTLDGSIGVNFYVKINDMDYVGDNAYMEMKLRNGKTLNVALTDERYDSAKGKYKFTFNVNSLQMAEDITATFHYGDGEKITRIASVKTYAEYVAESSENVIFVNLANAILTYGYYAQKALQETHGFTLGDDGKYRAMDDTEHIPAMAQFSKNGYDPWNGVFYCLLCDMGVNNVTCPTCNGAGNFGICPVCNGSGESPDDPDEDCGNCDGDGWFFCPECDGDCTIYSGECVACGGTGEIFRNLPSFEMKIDGSDDNITGLSMSLALDNKTDIYLYVTAQTMPEISGVEGATIVKSGDRYKVTIPNIAAHEITKTYTVNIGGYTVQVSAASYIYSVLKSTTRSFNYKCAVAALYDYFISAVIYMN